MSEPGAVSNELTEPSASDTAVRERGPALTRFSLPNEALKRLSGWTQGQPGQGLSLVADGSDVAIKPVAPLAPITRLRAFLASLDRTLIRGSAAAFGLSVGSTVLGFAAQVLLARALGSSEYGLYLYVIGWANVAGLFCALEFPVTGTRYVSAYATNHEWGPLRGFLRRSHQIVGGLSILVALIGIATALAFPKLFPFAASCIIGGSIVFPLTTLSQLHTGLLQGLKRVIHAQAPFQVVRPLVFVALVVGATFGVGLKGSAPAAIAAQAIATGIALVMTAVLLHRDLPAETRDVEPAYRTREWLSTSGHFLAISVAQLILSTQTDVLVVGTILGTKEAGLYGAASQFSALVSFGATAIMVMAQPMIAELYARGELAQLRRISWQIIRLSLLASVPVFVGIVVIGPWLLSLFGRAFVAAYPVMVMLSLAQLIAGAIGMLVGYLLTMTAHQRVASKIIGATAILDLALIVVLTPPLGMLGTAIATTVATLARSIGLLVAVRRRLGSGRDGELTARTRP